MAALVLACLALLPLSARAATTIHLQADRIDFYYDRYLVEANGHVRVTTSDGETITGDTFSMDLKLNRFLIASNVHLRSAGGNLDGAAISDFLDFHRIYFVPVISKPDRWTYLNGDFKKPLKGRIMPGDVFYFPNLSHSQVNYSAKSAVIVSKEYLRLQNVQAHFFGAPGVPLPSFYIYFGSSQDLAQNSLSGANFDATWNFAGDAHYISALHVRYDSYNHAYLALEQHFAGTDPHEYAVFSVNPATRFEKYWNAVTGEHIGQKFQVSTFTQLFTEQHALSEPYASAITTYVSMIQALPHSSLQSFFNQTNYNLLGTDVAALDHPNFDTLTWSSFNNRIFKTPFYLLYRSEIGFNHDAVTPLQVYGGYPYTTIWNHLLDATFSLPNVKFGNLNKAYGAYAFNGAFDWQRQWYSVPHHVNTQNTTLSLSRQFSKFVNTYLTYNVLNTSDLYNQGGYEPYVPPVTAGQPQDYGYAAFRGASTQRTLTLGTTYSASPNLVTTLTFAHHQDFPAAYPGLFALPPLNAIGQFEYSNYLGQPPWQLGAEVRARLLPHLSVDVQRTYFFHFGNEIWSPQFVVQFEQ